MRRGTRVGQAYVAVSADGSGINEDIVDEFDKAGPGVEKAGDSHGEMYGESFSDKFRNRFDSMRDRMSAELSERLGRAGEVGGDQSGDSFAKSMIERLTKALGNRGVGNALGDDIAEAISERLELAIATQLDDIDAQMSSRPPPASGPRMPGVSGNRDPGDQQLYKSYDFYTLFESARTKLHETANAAIEKMDLDFAKAQQSAYDSILKDEAARAEFVAKFETARSKLHESTTAAILKDDERLLKSQQSLYDDLLKSESARAAFVAKFETARSKLHDATTIAIVKDDENLLKAQSALYEDLLKGETARATFVGKFEAARSKLHEASNEAILKDDAALFKDQQALYDTLAKEAAKRDEDTWKVRRATADSYTKYLAGLERGVLDERGNTLRRSAERDLDFSSIIGNALGKGSRNNALNLFGSSIGNLVGLTTKLTSAGTSLGSTFLSAFNQAGTGASFAQKALAGLSASGSSALTGISTTFASLAASAPVLAVGIGAVIVAMSVLASVAGALLGILTALVSTVASGLVGALLVAGPLLAGVAAAGGLLAVAFTSMTDAQGAALKSTFQPLKAELTGIGQLMITQMIPYFDTWSRNLQNALLLIAPLAQRLGDVFGRAGNIITSSFSGPGFQILFSQLGVYLPNIIMSLSRALGGFLNGIAGTFGALMPLVSRFSSYLAGVAQRFADWANSAGGQNAIVDFANRAVNSLLSLWNFVRQLGGLISDVLFSPSAQRAGNSIFDGLADAIGRARNAISDGSLEKWFTDAINFGSTLWSVIKALRDVFIALYNAGVLEAVGDAFITLADVFRVMAAFLEPVVNLMGFIGPVATAIVAPITAAVGALEALGDRLGGVANAMSGLLGLAQQLGVFDGGGSTGSQGGWVGAIGNALANGLQPAVTSAQFQMPDFNLQDLIGSGNLALNATSMSNGGYLPEPTKPEPPKWKNPYLEFANSLIAAAPTVQDQMRKALRQMNKAVKDTLTEAAKALGAGEAQDLLSGQISTLRDSGNSLVEQAQSTLSASAERLANAGSKKEARQALKEVKANQAALAAAQNQQAMLIRASNVLAAQTFVSPANVAALLAGQRVNATIADYADAREQLAAQLESANTALTDAIAMRNDYAAQVTDAAKAFGSILTAQAQTLNGVQQVLTAGDITANLTDRLEKLRDFQDNLRILLSRGLSQDAYKQLVDGGVEQGGAYVDALVAGGQGAVAEVNNLTGQINDIASQLGGEASSNLYQAGVDAAQGLVDGLNSLSGQLESAAARLGQTIALEIRRSLGIASPSRVLMDDMNHVGDGMVIGLDNQQSKVGSAAARLSQSVALSPSLAAAYAEGRVPSAVSGVSGNQDDPRFRDLIIQTPSEDPLTVGREVLNEVVGRLP